jgi:hypothetical protein
MKISMQQKNIERHRQCFVFIYTPGDRDIILSKGL